jgi:hypothetical protein
VGWELLLACAKSAGLSKARNAKAAKVRVRKERRNENIRIEIPPGLSRSAARQLKLGRNSLLY